MHSQRRATQPGSLGVMLATGYDDTLFRNDLTHHNPSDGGALAEGFSSSAVCVVQLHYGGEF